MTGCYMSYSSKGKLFMFTFLLVIFTVWQPEYKAKCKLPKIEREAVIKRNGKINIFPIFQDNRRNKMAINLCKRSPSRNKNTVKFATLRNNRRNCLSEKLFHFFSSSFQPTVAWSGWMSVSPHRILEPPSAWAYYKIDKKRIWIHVHKCIVGAQNRNYFYDSVRKRKLKKPSFSWMPDSSQGKSN